MYDETDATAGESTPSPKSPTPSACSAKPPAGTSNHPVAVASPARARGRPHPPSRLPRCRTQSMPASVSLPQSTDLPGCCGAPLACPTCGREPTTRHEALQQREDLAIVWLHLDGDRVTEARHCVVCQPHGPVIDVSCSCCGNGPLVAWQLPELGGQLAAPGLDWMQLPRLATSPSTAMPRRSQIAASITSRDAQDPVPILVTGRVLRPGGASVDTGPGPTRMAITTPATATPTVPTAGRGIRPQCRSSGTAPARGVRCCGDGHHQPQRRSCLRQQPSGGSAVP
jgi:hypothetical protein